MPGFYYLLVVTVGVVVVAVLLPSVVPPVTVAPVAGVPVAGLLPAVVPVDGVPVAVPVVVVVVVLVEVVGRGGNCGGCQLGLTYDNITVSLLPSHMVILPDMFIVAGGIPTPPEKRRITWLLSAPLFIMTVGLYEIPSGKSISIPKFP